MSTGSDSALGHCPYRCCIDAETVAYQDYVRVNGWKTTREQGLSRAEGKEYLVQDGDVMLFRFNV